MRPLPRNLIGSILQIISSGGRRAGAGISSGGKYLAGLAPRLQMTEESTGDSARRGCLNRIVIIMKTSLSNRATLVAFATAISLFPITSLRAQVNGKAGVDASPSEHREPAKSPTGAPVAPGETVAQPVDLNPKIVQAEPLKDDQKVPKTDLTIPEIVAGSEDFTTLMGAIKAAGLDATLRGDGPFTVLAPNNAAFAALPEGVLSMLLKPDNKKLLKKILTYHVLPVKMMAADFVPGDLDTVEGEPITVVGKAKGLVTIQGAKLGITDVNAKNGVIQTIDHVLIPPSVDIEGSVKPGTPATKLEAPVKTGARGTE